MDEKGQERLSKIEAKRKQRESLEQKTSLDNRGWQVFVIFHVTSPTNPTILNP